MDLESILFGHPTWNVRNFGFFTTGRNVIFPKEEVRFSRNHRGVILNLIPPKDEGAIADILAGDPVTYNGGWVSASV